MKNKFITLIIFLSPYFLFSQEGLKTCETLSYTIEGKSKVVNSITITNESNDSLIIWLSKNRKLDYNGYFQGKGDFPAAARIFRVAFF